jgi:hypothetical protein
MQREGKRPLLLLPFLSLTGIREEINEVRSVRPVCDTFIARFSTIFDSSIRSIILNGGTNGRRQEMRSSGLQLYGHRQEILQRAMRSHGRNTRHRLPMHASRVQRPRALVSTATPGHGFSLACGLRPTVSLNPAPPRVAVLQNPQSSPPRITPNFPVC